jgi:undecaprenyl-diphosphatase
MMETITTLDQQLAIAVNALVGQSLVLDRFMAQVMQLPLVKLGPIVLLAIWLWSGRDQGDGHGPNPGRRTMVVLVMGVVCTLATTIIVQNLVPNRPRPIYDPALGLTIAIGLPVGILRDWSSFPSDHASLSFAMATAIWLHSRRLGALALIWAALAACAPRFFLGLHYPSDLIGGAVIGIVVTALVARSALIARGEAAMARAMAFSPAAFQCGAFVLLYLFMTTFNDLRTIARLAAKYFGFH